MLLVVSPGKYMHCRCEMSTLNFILINNYTIYDLFKPRMLPMGIYFNCLWIVNAQFILFLTRKNLECVHKLTNETNDTRNERTNYMNETQTNPFLKNYQRYPFETWNTCSLSKEEQITIRQMTLWFLYPELSALVLTYRPWIVMLPMGIYFNCVYELLMHNLFCF
jgi:hypothetical protein